MPNRKPAKRKPSPRFVAGMRIVGSKGVENTLWVTYYLRQHPN